jgi:hypothetical protein
MTDIVERLKADKAFLSNGICWNLMDEAADDIERLRGVQIRRRRTGLPLHGLGSGENWRAK